MTDAELLADVESGLSSSQIAAKYGITRQAVNKRRGNLRQQVTTLAVVAQPENRRLVSRELDAIAVLNECMQRLLMLSDAYHEFLKDPAHPDRYNVGPRGSEIQVVYYEPGDMKPSKASLQSLVERAEGKYLTESVVWKAADARSELRNTIKTIGDTVNQMVDLAQLLADVRAMETLREALLAEIAEVDADVAQRIAVKIRRRLVLVRSGSGSDTVSAGRGDGAGDSEP